MRIIAADPDVPEGDDVPEIPDKTFYRLGEVCQATDTQPYVLRFWESEFPQLANVRTRNGQRVYSRDDIELILRIKRLLYEEEYTIADARRALEGASSSSAAGRRTRTEEQAALPLDGAPAAAEAKAGAAESRVAALESKLAELRRRYDDAVREIATLKSAEAELAQARAALAASDAARRAERERALRVADRLDEVAAALATLGVGTGHREDPGVS